MHIYLVFSEQHFGSEDGRADVAGSRVGWQGDQRPDLPILSKHDEDVVTELCADHLSRDPVDWFLCLSCSDERRHDEPCPGKTLGQQTLFIFILLAAQ